MSGGLIFCLILPEIVVLVLKASMLIEQLMKSKDEGTLEAVVFVGEYLQVLTGGFFKAAIHRVMAGGRTDMSDNKDRISCPLLLRGRNSARIEFNSDKYSHPFKDDLGNKNISFHFCKYRLLNESFCN